MKCYIHFSHINLMRGNPFSCLLRKFKFQHVFSSFVSSNPHTRAHADIKKRHIGTARAHITIVISVAILSKSKINIVKVIRNNLADMKHFHARRGRWWPNNVVKIPYFDIMCMFAINISLPLPTSNGHIIKKDDVFHHCVAVLCTLYSGRTSHNKQCIIYYST